MYIPPEHILIAAVELLPHTSVKNIIFQGKLNGFHYISIEKYQLQYPSPALSESYWLGTRWH